MAIETLGGIFAVIDFVSPERVQVHSQRQQRLDSGKMLLRKTAHGRIARGGKSAAMNHHGSS